MSTSETPSRDWYIGLVMPSRTELIVEKLRAQGVKVANFRQEEQQGHRGGRTSVVQRAMFPGYIFMRGREALEIKALPFAPALLRSEDDFKTVRATDLKRLFDEFGGTLFTLAAQQRLKKASERQDEVFEVTEEVRKTLSTAFRMKEPVAEYA